MSCFFIVNHKTKNMRTINARLHGLFMPIIVFALLVAGSLSGCKKSDKYIEKSENVIVEKFFQAPPNVDASIKDLIRDMRLKESKSPFIAKLAENQGYPLWEKAVVIAANNKPTDDINNRNGSKKFIVPLIKKPTDRVYAAILSDKTNDNYRYKLFKYGGSKNYANVDAAREVAMFFMYLENKVFGRSYFRYTDKRFFENDSSKVEPIILFKERKISISEVSADITFQVCQTYDECTCAYVDGVYTETRTGRSIEICNWVTVQLPQTDPGGGRQWSWNSEDFLSGGGSIGAGSGGGTTIPTQPPAPPRTW
jgi:hypothetical protein